MSSKSTVETQSWSSRTGAMNRLSWRLTVSRCCAASTHLSRRSERTLSPSNWWPTQRKFLNQVRKTRGINGRLQLPWIPTTGHFFACSKTNNSSKISCKHRLRRSYTIVTSARMPGKDVWRKRLSNSSTMVKRFQLSHSLTRETLPLPWSQAKRKRFEWEESWKIGANIHCRSPCPSTISNSRCSLARIVTCSISLSTRLTSLLYHTSMTSHQREILKWAIKLM